MASSCYPTEINDYATFSSEVMNLKNMEGNEIKNVSTVENCFPNNGNSLQRSETTGSIEATTETDSRLGMFNTKPESLEFCLDAFENLKISKTVSDLIDNDNDNSSEITNINAEVEKSPQTESGAKPFFETNNMGQSRQKFKSGQLSIKIQNMYGNVYMNSPLKKCDVSNPDGKPYSDCKTGGGCLLNSISLDKDIQLKWAQICNEFQISCPSDEPNDKYEFLYENLRVYLLGDNQITRYQFLFRLSNIADITHLCKQ